MIFRGYLKKVLKEATEFMERCYPKTDNPFSYHFVAFEPRDDLDNYHLGRTKYVARMKENLDTPEHPAQTYLTDHNQIVCTGYTGKFWKAILK